MAMPAASDVAAIARVKIGNLPWSITVSWMKVLMLVAFGLFAMAIGMDFIEGIDEGFENDVMVRVADYFSTFPSRAVHFSKSIEEFLEMAGTTVFLFVFLKTLMSATPSIKFDFGQQQ